MNRGRGSPASAGADGPPRIPAPDRAGRGGRGWRVAANLATVANALSGAGAIAYILLGNKLFALFLLLVGVGWDGLDGLFSRRSRVPGGRFGRTVDSIADAVTFGVAPALLVGVNTYDRGAWAPWDVVAGVLAGLTATLAIARLAYYTTVAYRRPHFSGASTPQNAMWVALLVLLFQVPGFLGELPLPFFVLVGAALPVMVAPVRYPKLRRGAPLRTVALLLAGCLASALVLLNLRALLPPGPAGAVYLSGFVLSALAFGLLAFFYTAGPYVTPRTEGPPSRSGGPGRPERSDERTEGAA